MTVLNNKFTNQVNLCLLSGNILGFGISFIIPPTFVANMVVITSMAAMVAYFAVKSLQTTIFPIMNPQMASILINHYIETGEILDPTRVNRLEWIVNPYHWNINFGNKTPTMLINDRLQEKIVHLVDIFRDFPFFLHFKRKFSFVKMRYVYTINVFLELNANDFDVFCAYFLAIKVSKQLTTKMTDLEIINIIRDTVENFNLENMTQITSTMESLGWRLEMSNLEKDYNRYWMLIKES